MAKKLFKPGQSGNPGGRPAGSRNRMKLQVEDFVTVEQVQGVVAKVLELAKEGDMSAAAMVLDRVLPKLRPRVADVGGEAELAAEIAAARGRALRAGGFTSLEQLVVLSAVPEPDPLAPAFIAPMTAPPAQAAPPAAPASPPPFRMSAWSDDDGQAAATDYDPMARN